MIFVQLNSGDWWEYDNQRNRIYNFRGGHTYLEDDLSTYKTAHFDSWHSLYLQTGFNPLIDREDLYHCGWIAPNGDFYPCDAHEFEAEYICSLIYGEEHGCHGDILIERGWKKVTNSLLFDYYNDQGHYDTFSSDEQEEVFLKWLGIYMLEE